MNPGVHSALYLSVPFCRTKCSFCNFASGVSSRELFDRYIAHLEQAIASAPALAHEVGTEFDPLLDSVYLGGGTPSILAPDQLDRLFAAIARVFELSPQAEFTVEVAPGTLSEEVLAALLRAGVNRVSLGVQSFVDQESRSVGRLHTRGGTLGDVARLRQSGISEISVDLIAGLPYQTQESWERSLDEVVALDVPHASVYMLEVDEDSRLGREMLSGGARYHAGLVPTDDAIAQMYSWAIERLGDAGLEQYEISNFCRPGFKSRHNLRYWQRRPYLGLGLDASSMLRAALHEGESGIPRYVLRSTTTDDLAAFLEGPQAVETAWLGPARQLEEAWFLGLRLNAGVEVSSLENEFGAEMVAAGMEAVERLVEDGLLTWDGETARLTAGGRLISNNVFQEFLGSGLEEGGADERIRAIAG
jgi:oxygen-independent coproporphyrinogen-3 oxidase